MIISRNGFKLATKISDLVNLPVVCPEINIYPSNEIEVKFPHISFPDTIYLIYEVSTELNNSLITLLLIINALKRCDIKNIIFIATYLPYLRYDRIKFPNTSYGSKFIADILNNSGISKLVLVEPHFPQISGFFDIITENISTKDLFINSIESQFPIDDVVIVSPDIGGYKNVVSIGNKLNTEVCCASKTRNSGTNSLKLNFFDNIENKICIIVDDLIDTGNTILQLASILKEKKAKKIIVYVTHGVFSKNCFDLINSSFIDKIYTTDTIYQTSAHNKIEIISIAGIIADYIKKTWKF